jgi:hypothetical protein
MPEDTEPTPEQQLLSNVRGIIGEYEHAKLLERTRRGLIGRAKAGFPPPPPPYGYRYVHEKRRGAYEAHPDEAPVVHRIFQQYVAQGLTMQRIVAILTQDRIPTKGHTSDVCMLPPCGTKSACVAFWPTKRIQAPFATAKHNVLPGNRTRTKRREGVPSSVRSRLPSLFRA